MELNDISDVSSDSGTLPLPPESLQAPVFGAHTPQIGEHPVTKHVRIEPLLQSNLVQTCFRVKLRGGIRRSFRYAT